MEFRNTLAMTASALLITLTGCGGGGGGGAPAEQPRAPATPTTLPIFLQSQIDKCSFVENGAPVALAGYSGTLSAVTELNCADTQFANFDEIELLSGMTALRLTNANLTSVDALQGLTSLTTLDLSGNNLSNLSTAAGLTNLVSLNLSDNSLADISELQSLTQLNTLDLSNNSLTDLTALSNLMALQNLNLATNNIADLAPLTALLELTELRLNGNEQLVCSDVYNLKATIESTDNGHVIVPAQCGVSFLLGDNSAANVIIDNAMESPPYDRIQIIAPYTEQDVALFSIGDDLKVQLNSADGPKSITFTAGRTRRGNTISIFGFSGDKEYSFSEFQNLVGLGISLTEMDDVYKGTSYSDIIYGLDGDDVIYGNGGTDTFIGGPGDDILFGDSGSLDDEGKAKGTTLNGSNEEIFIFNIGDGNDTIANRARRGRTSILKFGSGIEPDDIQLSRADNDLVFKFSNYPSDSITIRSSFYFGTAQLKSIQFEGQEPLDAVTFVESKM